MDLLVTVIGDGPNQRADMKSSLRRIATQCAWTKGKWPDILRDWNDLQVTSRDKKLLTEQIVSLYHQKRLARVA
jgi:hypothetical protein